MGMKVNNQRVVGHGVLPSFVKKEAIEVRKAKEGVTPEQLQDAAKHNGFDEIAFKTEGGDLYIAVADELNIKGRLGLAKAGDHVQIGELEGTVVFSDNEINKTRLAIGLAASTLIGGPLAGAAVMGQAVAGANILTAVPLALVGTLRAFIAMGAVGAVGLLSTGAAAVMDGHDAAALQGLTDPVKTLNPDEQ